MLFDFRRDSLRAELAVTCTRDQTSTGHVDIGATTPRFGPPLGPGTQTGPSRPEYWDRERPNIQTGLNIGTGIDLLYPQGLRTRILDVRIYVLALDSVVNDVAMIVDTRDNLRQ